MNARRLSLEIRPPRRGSGGVAVERRKATVVAVGTATVDIQFAGSALTLTGIHHAATYTPAGGDIVWVSVWDTDLLVEGTQS